MVPTTADGTEVKSSRLFSTSCTQISGLVRQRCVHEFQVMLMVRPSNPIWSAIPPSPNSRTSTTSPNTSSPPTHSSTTSKTARRPARISSKPTSREFTTRSSIQRRPGCLLRYVHRQNPASTSTSSKLPTPRSQRMDRRWTKSSRGFIPSLPLSRSGRWASSRQNKPDWKR